MFNQSHKTINITSELIKNMVDDLEKGHLEKQVIQLDQDKDQEASSPRKRTRGNLKQKVESTSLDEKDSKNGTQGMSKPVVEIFKALKKLA